MKHNRKLLSVLLALMMVLSAVGPVVSYASGAGWEKIDSTWYYSYEDGSYASGWQKIDEKWYYFSADGAMQTGWQYIDGKWYYLNNAMQTGWQYIDGKWYYLNNAMQTGWQNIDGKWYYLNNAMQTGWQHINGTWYYLNNAMQTGWQHIDGKWYYFNSSGAMQTGWQQINNKWYYLGNNGAMQTGWVNTSDKWYYTDASGAMQTGWISDNGKWFYCEPDSEPEYIFDWETGLVQIIEKDYGAMQTGWLELDGSVYYLRPYGTMVADGWESISGKWYYFNANGTMQTGWLNDNGTWYYLDEFSDDEYAYDAESYNYVIVAQHDYGSLVGKLPTESEAFDRLIALKSDYPEGMYYTNQNSYYWANGGRYGQYSYGYGCAGFAAMASDAAYGDLPVRYIGSEDIKYEDIHVGDILRVNGDRHSVVVLSKYDSYIVICEANYNSSVHWGRTMTKAEVLSANYMFTRWP